MVAIEDIFASPRLPTLPTVAVRLLELRDDPDSGLERMVAIVESDPAICARLLKVANSTYFALRKPVATIDRAVALLGCTVVTSVSLSFYLAEEVVRDGPLADYYRSFWLQSIVQAATADVVAKQSGIPETAGEAFLTGLLLDIGRLAMLSTLPADYLKVLQAAEQGQRDLHLVESEMLGFNHMQVGENLLSRWHFPASVTRAVAMHHHTATELEAFRDAKTVLFSAVASAVGDYFCGNDRGGAWQRLLSMAHSCCRLDESQLQTMLEEIRSRLEVVSSLFNTPTDEIPSLSELYAEAGSQLAALAVRESVAHIQSNQRIAVLEEENTQLAQEALYDPLTRIYNRRFVEEMLAREISRCCRAAEPIAVIFADIDHFKRINDLFGHQGGDYVLRALADVFKSQLRESDVLARYGGDEFVVLVNERTESGLKTIGENLRAAVANAKIIHEGDRIPVTISVGAAIALPGRNETGVLDRLMAAADAAMYESKQEGRNRVNLRSLIDDVERNLAQRVSQHRFSSWLVRKGVIDVETATRALGCIEPRFVRVGDLAMRLGYLDPHQIEQVLLLQEKHGDRFGQTAIGMKLITGDQLVHLLSLQQEDPTQFARALVRCKAVDETSIADLLKSYLAQAEDALKQPVAATH